jgi:hypothetical protein
MREFKSEDYAKMEESLLEMMGELTKEDQEILQSIIKYEPIKG